MVRIKKKILILIFIIISSFSIIFTISYLSFFSFVDGDGYVPVVITTRDDIGTPVLNPITPEVDNDGYINLEWSLSSSYLINGFQVWRNDPYGWFLKHELGNIHQFIAICNFDAIYEYKVRARATIDGVQYYSPFSNIQSVIVDMVEDEEEEEEPLPLNPSIIINDGAETTESLEVTLTLSCENADQMNIHISEGIWTGWVSYRTTYTIILFEDDPKNPDYTVGVIFKNDVGESGEVYDDITFQSTSIIPDIPVLNEITPAIDDDGWIHLSWNDVNLAISYYIYRSVDSINFDKIKEVSDNSYIDVITNNGTYWYKVSAKNGYGESDLSIPQTVSVVLTGSPPLPPAITKKTNYAIIYILIAILIGVSGIGIFLKYRNQIIKSK